VSDKRPPPGNTQPPPAAKPSSAGNTLQGGMPALRWRAPEDGGAPPAAPAMPDGEPRDTTKLPEGLGPALAHGGSVTISPRVAPPGQATTNMPVAGGPLTTPPVGFVQQQPAPPVEVVAAGGRTYGRRTTTQHDLPWQTQVNIIAPGLRPAGPGTTVGGLDVAQVARAMEIARAAEIGMAAQAAAAAQASPTLAPTPESQALVAGGHTAAIAIPSTIETQTPVTVYKLERPVEFDRRLVMLRDPDSVTAAAYRVLRYRVLERGQPQVIVVSSPRKGEGKSTCAVNLALALGECGRARVLLIEANLRSPSLARLLAFMPPTCFAEQVAAHKDEPDQPWVVVEAHSPWLHVAAVKPDRRGETLLDGPAMAMAIDQLRHAGYEHIVVDTPAVLGAADVNIVQDCADGVLLVARARQTAGRQLRRAIEQLQPSRVLGLTMLE
jgi:Mrp family chromosome partitioning ATPase